MFNTIQFEASGSLDFYRYYFHVSKKFFADFVSLNSVEYQYFYTPFITAHQRSCGKVMFSVLSVCLSVHRGYHVNITHNALHLAMLPFCIRPSLARDPAQSSLCTGPQP